MAEQTLNLPASSYISIATFVTWSFSGTDRPLIDASLTSGNTRYFSQIVLLSNGRVQLTVSSSQDESASDTGDDLSDAFEANGGLTLTVTSPSISLTVDLDGSDMEEPYLWSPTNSSEVITAYNALKATSTAPSAVLTLSDNASPPDKTNALTLFSNQGGTSFPGVISEFRVYSKVLNSTEVVHNYGVRNRVHIGAFEVGEGIAQVGISDRIMAHGTPPFAALLNALLIQKGVPADYAEWSGFTGLTIWDDVDKILYRVDTSGNFESLSDLSADQAANVASSRTLGTGALQAAEGDHEHNAADLGIFENESDAAADVASLRTLGSGALQAAAGNHTTHV